MKIKEGIYKNYSNDVLRDIFEDYFNPNEYIEDQMDAASVTYAIAVIKEYEKILSNFIFSEDQIE